MNISILRGKVFKNKSLYVKFLIYTLPIGWVMSYLMVQFLAHYIGIESPDATQSARSFILFAYLIFIGNTIQYFYMEIYLRRMLNAIKVEESGVTILGPFSQEQIVRWDEISAIQKSSSQKNVILQKEWNIYKVLTTIPGKFSLLKKSKFFFYITYNHESHKELLALLQEKTGLKIEEPTRKPKIPPWQPGNAR
jgi:hypothetical protein